MTAAADAHVTLVRRFSYVSVWLLAGDVLSTALALRNGAHEANPWLAPLVQRTSLTVGLLALVVVRLAVIAAAGRGALSRPFVVRVPSWWLVGFLPAFGTLVVVNNLAMATTRT